MGTLCDDLPGHVAKIVKEWDLFSRRESQLAQLPTGHRWDSLPKTTNGLLEASLCRPQDAATQRELVSAALEHGQDRRADGVSPDVIFAEYSVLHYAIWHHFQQVMSGGMRLDAILKIDMSISLATRASLSGYHRAEMEATGSWAGIIDYLIGEALVFSRGA